MEYIRDYAMYVAIFGFFSFVWFGWAQEKPRPKWRIPIGIATSLALLLSILGIYLSVTNWGAASALNEVGSTTAYLVTFYVEFFLAGLGSFLLVWKKKKNFVAPWILFIVGIHFVALEPIFKDPTLWILAGLLVGIALASIFIAPKLKVANSAIAGIGAGVVLFGFALLGLVRFLTA